MEQGFKITPAQLEAAITPRTRWLMLNTPSNPSGDFGALVTLEVGKIASEGLGEVQEMIDICDFAVGLSRQIYGLTIASERPGHRMMETWHPLGPCGIISAFNFPVAVWSWNAALALVCGDPVIWNPRKATTLVGPLINHDARDRMVSQLKKARSEGGVVHGGSPVTEGVPQGGAYVQPALVEMAEQTDIVRTETVAPILYVLGYETLDEAISLQNDVPQGLSSCIFTLNMREAETFMSAAGSDCGMANVNIGPSGAEIGGAFGGEKVTGGGRESGSDAWKGYMRRQTNTINFSAELPLAQGVKFDF